MFHEKDQVFPLFAPDFRDFPLFGGVYCFVFIIEYVCESKKRLVEQGLRRKVCPILGGQWQTKMFLMMLLKVYTEFDRILAVFSPETDLKPCKNYSSIK